MKKKILGLLSLTLTLSLFGCSTNNKQNNKNKHADTTESQKFTNKNSITTSEDSSNSESEEIDLSGDFYDTAGNIANIKSIGKNNWEITYSTPDGNVSATFETLWKSDNQVKKSETHMVKSDKNTDFKILIEYINPSNQTIKMEDGNVAHEMTFTKEKPAIDETYDSVLSGDLTPFAGQLTNDAFNKQIADSGFTLGGYTPDDYYNNRTSMFPTISKDGFWDGFTSHSTYKIEETDMPKKVNGFYEVHFYDEKNMEGKNNMLTFFLIPPKTTAPDGTVSDNKRVIQQILNGEQNEKDYLKENWWEDYQSK